MARANLSAMLQRLDPDPAASPANPSEEVESAPETPAPARPATLSSRTDVAQGPDAASRGYLSFERKETRLRADQYARLTQEARRLNKAKGTGGERITENTHIRVAIDLLFERVEDLNGATETELGNSVSL